MENRTLVNTQRVEGQTFVGANIQIDGGVAYVRCRFVNCNLIFTGTGPIQMENTAFENPRWSFSGPAGNTISFLRFLYANGQKEIVERLFATIRSGASQPENVSVPPDPSENPGGGVIQ